MVSKARNIVLVAVCLVFSAVLFYFGTGLAPWWPFAWLAPIPVLWLAPRISGWAAFLVAVFAYAAGGLNEWHMAQAVMSFWVYLLSLFLPGCLLGFATLLFRSRIRRGFLWQGAFIVPALWSACEFLTASVSPHSTAENLAYSQMNFLPILQIASITGIWGISFCVFLFAATVAALLSGKSSNQKQSLALGCTPIPRLRDWLRVLAACDDTEQLTSG
jgi:apolipoprotein N-acyltransferase